MRITPKGQVTIPQAICEKYGLLVGTEVTFVEREGAVTIVSMPSTRPDRAVALLRGTGRQPMTTDELLALTRG